jgi:hypothetical protein
MSANRRTNLGKAWLFPVAVAVVLAAACMTAWAEKAPTTQPAAGASSKPADTQPTDGKVDLVEMLKLPAAAFKETPKNLKTDEPVEPARKGARPKFLVPAGVKNVALGKKVTSSDKEPIIGDLKLITDGSKEATEGSYVELAPGTQWVQIDLEQEYKIQAIVIWHYHGSARVYKDVIVHVSNDPDFVEKTAVFNTDHDNSSGMGVGKNLAWIETYEGKIIDGEGTKGRYVRLYSRGNTSDDQNHYTEVEVYALPAK